MERMSEMFKIENLKEIKEKIEEHLGDKVRDALIITRHQIVIDELPSGESSEIASTLTVESDGGNRWKLRATSPVWSYLNYGTGMYNPDHAGQGPNGEIVPINKKALRFKNAELARALGFPNQTVFLKSVKGIKGRFFFEKALSPLNFGKNLVVAVVRGSG